METTGRIKWRHVTPEEKECILILVRKGFRKSHIAQILGFSYFVVHKVLKDAGVVLTAKGRPRLPKEFTDAVISLYNQGLPAIDVAEHFSIERSKVHDIVKAARKLDPASCQYRNIPTPKKRRIKT